MQDQDYGLVAAAPASLQPASSSVGPEQVLGVVGELLSDGVLAADCGDGVLVPLLSLLPLEPPLLELPPPPLSPPEPLAPLARATLRVVMAGAT